MNATKYCVVDVSTDANFATNSYVYFLNDSITFMGVRFESYFPSNFSGCPNVPHNEIQAYTSALVRAIRVNVTFADGDNEWLSQLLPSVQGQNYTILSKHAALRAGIYLEEVGSTNSAFKLLLLVEEL